MGPACVCPEVATIAAASRSRRKEPDNAKATVHERPRGLGTHPPEPQFLLPRLTLFGDRQFLWNSQHPGKSSARGRSRHATLPQAAGATAEDIRAYRCPLRLSLTRGHGVRG